MEKRDLLEIGLVIFLLISVFFNGLYAERIKNYEADFMEIYKGLGNYTSTMERAYDTLNYTKQTIIDQAETIDNLAVMVITYQLYFWDQGIPPPLLEFDNNTINWILDNYPNEV